MLEIFLRRLFNREEEAPPASSSAAQRLSHALRHNEYSVLYLFAPGALAEAEFVDACTALLGDPPVDATELSWLWKQGAHEGRLSFVHLRELCLNSDHAAPVTTFTTRSSTRGCLDQKRGHSPAQSRAHGQPTRSTMTMRRRQTGTTGTLRASPPVAAVHR